jgi:ATP-dependent helicase/nuclease subunit B
MSSEGPVSEPANHHYLGWGRPFSVQLAERLRTERGDGAGYDEWLVWVPSARAGRHVLNQLFSGDPMGVEALHPPRMVTPAQFVRSLADAAEGIATESQCLLAWKRAVEATPAERLEPAFPVVPADQVQAWAFAVAGQLMRLRARLAEDEWNFAKVAAQELPHDRDRWAVLAWLEERMLAGLAAAGLRDPDDWLADRLAAGRLEAPWRRLLVAGVLNLSRREARCVEALAAAGMEVSHYLPYPESRKDDFDALGRPLAGVWDREPLADRLLAGRVQRAAEPRELADGVLELAGAYGERIEALVVGCTEADLSRFLIERSRLGEQPFYAPEGKPLTETAWGRLIRLFTEWRRGGSLAILVDLLNHGLFRDWMVRSGMDAGRTGRALLQLRKEHLFRDARQLADPGLRPSRAVAQTREFLERLDALLPAAGPERFVEGIWELLQSIADGAELADEARAVLRQLEELLADLRADMEAVRPGAAEYAELLHHLLSGRRHFPEREADERPVSGWLELPWETAPHMVLLGLPDAAVPGSKAIDAFLTPALCRALGLYGPDELAAFHAFRLRLLLESWRDWGRVDLLLPDRGLDDSPVLPCRFLFLADEEEILGRVRLLLGERDSPEGALPARFGAALHLPEPAPLERLSVTAFSAYLLNPFHFFLQRRMRWSPPEPLPREMDALGFGTLAHTVMQALNGTAEGAGLLDPKAVDAFLEAALEAAARAAYGTRLAVPLRIQLASLRERLRAAAPLIAAERQAGWLPEKVEWAFHDEVDLRIAGVQLRGMIDLLERNAETGALRIVDYKTSDKSEGARRSHLLQPGSRSAAPLFARQEFLINDKVHRWKDLQLPLYQRAVELHAGQVAECAYFGLGKAIADVGMDHWMPSADERQAALACAEAIIGSIRDGHFPPAGASRYEDPWLAWFGGDYAAALDPQWRARHMEEPA